MSMATQPDDASIEAEQPSLRERIRQNPRPALVWVGVLGVLLLLELGAVLTGAVELVSVTIMVVTALLDVIVGGINGLINSIVSNVTGNSPDLLVPVVDAVLGFQSWSTSGLDWVQANITKPVPTLLSREVIPNDGYWNGEQWVGTFLGLQPGWAWLVRFLLVYIYSAVTVYWVLRGYFVFRRHYRVADWTPRDDIVNRLSTHRWGQFGAIIVFLFLTMALFAPTLGPTTVDENVYSPYTEEHKFKYWDAEAQELKETYPGQANLNSKSKGAGDQHVGPLDYDNFGRFHPFGTDNNGQDLFTYIVAGSRISLFVGLIAIGLGGFLAVTLALLSAYYKGLVDLMTVLASDSVMSMPQLLLLIMASVAFQNHWLKDVYSGALLIALLFAFSYWPGLWRSLRGPALQVAEEEWVDAAKSYGQNVRLIMQKHMLPYVLGYLLIYGSMSLGGVIIGTSALSFLGIGIEGKVPEWGKAIANGQPYVNTQSAHTSLIPGVLIVLVVTAFNALGDGIRDAIDPQSEGGGATESAMASGGGA